MLETLIKLKIKCDFVYTPAIKREKFRLRLIALYVTMLIA